jgi:regulatory protein YycI of two-component signal transduction system YycFG
MDWGRAKSVLISAFLLLNIVLGYQLWIDIRDQAQSNLDIASLSESAQRALENKRIQVTAQIPRETPMLAPIPYQTKISSGTQPVPLQRPVDSQLIFNEDELAVRLASQIPNIGQYQYDALITKQGIFVLHPLINNDLPLFNMNLELYYSNQKIISYTAPRFTLEQDRASKPNQEILSASTALGTVIENDLPEGAVVKDITLGYYGQKIGDNIQLAVPVWRIALESGAFYYVQGITGEVTTTPAAENEE